MDENVAYANAWRYRDYVIARLQRRQALRPVRPGTDRGRPARRGPATIRLNHERLIATGFLVLGPKMLAEDDPVKMEMDIIDEQVDTVGRVFMGLTLGCARCHDHKFDPIPTADYYGLAGIFKIDPVDGELTRSSPCGTSDRWRPKPERATFESP